MVETIRHHFRTAEEMATILTLINIIQQYNDSGQTTFTPVNDQRAVSVTEIVKHLKYLREISFSVQRVICSKIFNFYTSVLKLACLGFLTTVRTLNFEACCKFVFAYRLL